MVKRIIAPKRGKSTRFNPYDLFGEIIVTENDIIDWVEATAPRWLTPRRSFEGYVRSYDVAGKVRAAKIAGIFHEIIENRPVQWHARFALASIL